jgi:hypothetical protein
MAAVPIFPQSLHIIDIHLVSKEKGSEVGKTLS